jgi:tRNA(Ile)-lysidine synthase
MHFAAFRGTLHFDQAEEGVDADWLRAQELAMHCRQGGERLKPAPNRPTRSLKQHYQALNIPSWEREHLPLVSVGEQLVFAAGVGMDCHYFSSGTGARIHFRWQHDKV